MRDLPSLRGERRSCHSWSNEVSLRQELLPIRGGQGQSPKRLINHPPKSLQSHRRGPEERGVEQASGATPRFAPQRSSFGGKPNGKQRAYWKTKRPAKTFPTS